jgi:hypothetical protein
MDKEEFSDGRACMDNINIDHIRDNIVVVHAS